MVINYELCFFSYLKRFTMDTIWNCAFGYDIDVQNQPDNPYFHRCEQVFADNVELKLINYIGSKKYKFKRLFKQIKNK